MKTLVTLLLFACAVVAQTPQFLDHVTGSGCNGSQSADDSSWAVALPNATSAHSMAAYTPTSGSEVLVGVIIHSFGLAGCSPIPDVCGTERFYLNLAPPDFLFAEIVVDSAGVDVGAPGFPFYEYTAAWQMTFDVPTIGPLPLVWYSQWVWTFAGTNCWHVSGSYAGFAVI